MMRDVGFILLAIVGCFGPFFAVYIIEDYYYRKKNNP